MHQYLKFNFCAQSYAKAFSLILFPVQITLLSVSTAIPSIHLTFV